MINGNIKIFDLSKALFKNGASVSATSGQSSADNMIDFNKLTRSQSVGSNDTTTETWVVTMDEPATISRLIFIDFNYKQFTITPVTSPYMLDYEGDPLLDDPGAPLEDDGGILAFRNVISSTNAIPQTGISETDHELPNQYYEFDPIYCTGFTINVTVAQRSQGVYDQEKYCSMCIPTIEIDDNQGTFEQFPVLQNMTDFKSINAENMGGKNLIQKLDPVFNAVISMKVVGVQNDIRILQYMRYSDLNFLVFPSGGKLNPGYFRFDSVPFSFEVYEMQVKNSLLASYIGNITSNAMSMSLGIGETL